MKNKKLSKKGIIAVIIIIGTIVGAVATIIDFTKFDTPVAKVKAIRGFYLEGGVYVINCEILEIYDLSGLRSTAQKISTDGKRCNLWPYGEITERGEVYYYFAKNSVHSGVFSHINRGFASSRWYGFVPNMIKNTILSTLILMVIYIIVCRCRKKRSSE